MSDSGRRVEIRTPEGIVFPMRIAGPVRRFLALLLDQAAILAAAQAASGLLRGIGLLSGDLYAAASALTYFVLATGYPMALEWKWRGQTLGKRLLRIRVIDEQGLRLTFSQVAVRNMVRFADSLPAFYLLGGAFAFFSPRGQRLGDIAGNTLVIWQPRTRAPDLDRALPETVNSFRDYPRLVARLRDGVSPAEAGLALEAILRRDRLSPDARVERFREIADHFRDIVAFPPECTDGLSDERYVRNVVDVVFREGPHHPRPDPIRIDRAPAGGESGSEDGRGDEDDREARRPPSAGTGGAPVRARRRPGGRAVVSGPGREKTGGWIGPAGPHGGEPG